MNSRDGAPPRRGGAGPSRHARPVTLALGRRARFVCAGSFQRLLPAEVLMATCWLPFGAICSPVAASPFWSLRPSYTAHPLVLFANVPS